MVCGQRHKEAFLLNYKGLVSYGVPVLVPVRTSPVPSVVRGSFVVKFLSTYLCPPHPQNLPEGSHLNLS